MTSPADDTVHVLLVTTDEDYATETADRLSSLNGIEVTSTESVGDAMATLASTSTIECVVSDHDLPDIDAIAFLETVRLKYIDLPFILFTTAGNERIGSRAIHARVTDYLIKELHRNQWDLLGGLIRQAVEYYRTHSTVPTDDSRIQSLTDAMDDIILVFRDGAIQYVNKSGTELLGIPEKADFIGTAFLDLFIEENEITRETLEAVQRGDLYIEAIGEQVIDVSGMEIPVELTVSRIHWDGEPATLAILSDRSGYASLEQRLHEVARINSLIREVNHLIISAQSREELEQNACVRLVESGDYRLAWIGDLDPSSGEIEPRANAGFEEGYLDEVEITTRDEPTAKGPSGQAINSGEIQVVQDIAEDPAFAPWREEAIERGYRSSAAIPLVSDDHTFGVLNLYSDRTAAFNRSEREMLETLGEDIAHGIRSIEDRSALQRSQDRLGLALQAARAGIWDWDIQSGELFWDTAVERLFGLDPGTFEGDYEAFAKQVHPEDLPAVEQEIEDALDETDRIESEFRIRPDDANERWVLSLGDVHRDEQGDPDRVLGINRDITDRKEREQHLRVVDRVLRHNLRNDINFISGAAETIAQEADSDLAELADGIIRYGKKLLETADKEREIVEIFTDEPRFHRVAITPLVEDVVNRMADRYPDAQIALQTEDEMPRITIADRFSRAIEELVENAVIHNDQDRPQVSVSVDQTASEIHVTVEDNGPPIPEMNIGVLTRAAEEPLYHGSGLGLWLVHWIVRQSNGQIEFREQAAGNVVTIRLPISDHATSADSERVNTR